MDNQIKIVYSIIHFPPTKFTFAETLFILKKYIEL